QAIADRLGLCALELQVGCCIRSRGCWGRAVGRRWSTAAGATREMESDHVPGIFDGELGADARANICPLRTVPGVAQARHELRPICDNALGPIAPLTWFVRKTESRHRWNHDVEGIFGASAITDWIGEWPNH